MIGIGAAANAIRAGAAFVEIGGDATPVKEAMGSIKSAVESMGGHILKAQALLAGFLTTVSYGGLKSIEAAASLQEQQAKFNMVFKHNVEGMNAWRDEFMSIMGLSKTELTTWMATAQDTFVPLGFAREDAAELSKLLVRLGLDLAAFNEMSPEDTQHNLISGLVGEPEALRKYGIIINQAALDQELFNMGVTGGTEAASEQEKMLARLSIILKSTTDAQGQAIRESDSWTMSTRRLSSQLSALKTEIGEQLLPMVQPWVDFIADAVQATKEWIAVNPGIVQSLAKVYVSLQKISLFLGIFFAIGLIIGTWPGRILLVGVAVLALLDYLGMVDTGFKDLTDSVFIFGDTMSGHIEKALLKVKIFFLYMAWFIRALFNQLGDVIDEWAAKIQKAIVGKYGLLGGVLSFIDGLYESLKVLGLIDKNTKSPAKRYEEFVENHYDTEVESRKQKRDETLMFTENEIDKAERGLAAINERQFNNAGKGNDWASIFSRIRNNEMDPELLKNLGLDKYEIPDIKAAPKEDLDPKKDLITGFFGGQRVSEQLGAALGVFDIDRQQLSALKDIHSAVTALPQQISSELSKTSESNETLGGGGILDQFNIPKLPTGGVSEIISPPGSVNRSGIGPVSPTINSGNSEDMRRLIQVTEKIENNTRNSSIPTYR